MLSDVVFFVRKLFKIIGIHSDEKKSITITIESKEVAESFIQQFEVLWKIAVE